MHGWRIKAHPWFKGVTWDLLRNQAPPLLPPAKDVEIRAGRQLEPLAKVFHQLDREEKKKLAEAQAKATARRREQEAAGKPREPSPEVDRTGDNDPARLLAFNTTLRDMEGSGGDGDAAWLSSQSGGSSSGGAYGSDLTGREKWIAAMEKEAERRARYLFTLGMLGRGTGVPYRHRAPTTTPATTQASLSASRFGMANDNTTGAFPDNR